MQAVAQSADLCAALEDDALLRVFAASQPHIRRDCVELFVWWQFYQLER